MKTDIHNDVPILRTSADCDDELFRLHVLGRPRHRRLGVARLKHWLLEQEAEAFAEASKAAEQRARARMAQFETSAAEAW
jgi:hypothetical protein